jgi:hypothetical protein
MVHQIKKYFKKQISSYLTSFVWFYPTFPGVQAIAGLLVALRSWFTSFINCLYFIECTKGDFSQKIELCILYYVFLKILRRKKGKRYGNLWSLG